MDKPNTYDSKKRAPNFTGQDCLLLAQIMGNEHPDFVEYGLSFHKVDKHRFNSMITSSTKKALWQQVSDTFNSSASLAREPQVLQKKWDNLVAKHRNIYSDYLRARALTGRGPPGTPVPSALTEAVMSCVGKESVSILGVAGGILDSTLIGITPNQHTPNGYTVTEEDEDGDGNVDGNADGNVDGNGNILNFEIPPFSNGRIDLNTLSIPRGGTRLLTPPQKTKRQSCSCCCDPAIVQLKKRKLELQIRYYQKLLEE